MRRRKWRQRRPSARVPPCCTYIWLLEGRRAVRGGCQRQRCKWIGRRRSGASPLGGQRRPSFSPRHPPGDPRRILIRSTDFSSSEPDLIILLRIEQKLISLIDWDGMRFLPRTNSPWCPSQLVSSLPKLRGNEHPSFPLGQWSVPWYKSILWIIPRLWKKKTKEVHSSMKDKTHGNPGNPVICVRIYV